MFTIRICGSLYFFKESISCGNSILLVFLKVSSLLSGFLALNLEVIYTLFLLWEIIMM